MKYSCQIKGITNRWVYYAIIASFCNAYKSVTSLLNATVLWQKNIILRQGIVKKLAACATSFLSD